MAAPEVDKYGAAGFGTLEQRIHGADQVPIRRDIDGHDLVPGRRLDMLERRALAGQRGIADQHVEPLVAFVERGGEPVEAGKVLHIERHQRRRTAGRARRVVELFQRADGAGDRDHMRARRAPGRAPWRGQCRGTRR